MTCFAECHEVSELLCSHFLAGCSNKMDTACSNGGRVKKCFSVHGGAEEFWWIKQKAQNHKNTKQKPKKFWACKIRSWDNY